MWLLPPSPPALAIPPGPYLVPWYFDDPSLDRLAMIVRRGLELDAELHLDDLLFQTAHVQRFSLRRTLLVIRLKRADGAPAEALERAMTFGSPLALIRWPLPLEDGYGWMPVHVKKPLVRALASWFGQPSHPLATVRIDRLPVHDAAAFTTDPIELLELLEAALSHRLQHAGNGLTEAAYLQSLHVAVGRRLAKRLDPTSPLGLRLIMGAESAGGEAVEDGDALERCGLGHRVAGVLRLEPLARRARDPRVRTALERALRRDGLPDDLLLSNDRGSLHLETYAGFRDLLGAMPMPPLPAIAHHLLMDHTGALQSAAFLLAPSTTIAKRIGIVLDRTGSNSTQWTPAELSSVLAPARLELANRSAQASAGERARNVAVDVILQVFSSSAGLEDLQRFKRAVAALGDVDSTIARLLAHTSRVVGLLVAARQLAVDTTIAEQLLRECLSSPPDLDLEDRIVSIQARSLLSAAVRANGDDAASSAWLCEVLPQVAAGASSGTWIALMVGAGHGRSVAEIAADGHIAESLALIDAANGKSVIHRWLQIATTSGQSSASQHPSPYVSAFGDDYESSSGLDPFMRLVTAVVALLPSDNPVRLSSVAHWLQRANEPALPRSWSALQYLLLAEIAELQSDPDDAAEHAATALALATEEPDAPWAVKAEALGRRIADDAARALS